MSKVKKDPEVLSAEKAEKIFSGMDRIRAARYFDVCMGNSDTPEENMTVLQKYRDDHPEKFASPDEVKNYQKGAAAKKLANQKNGGYGRRSASSGGDAPDERERANRRYWRRFWKSDEEYKAMSPKERHFFSRAYKSRNRAANTAYGLRVLTNPDSTEEDKDAMVKTVRKNSHMYFYKTSDFKKNKKEEPAE